jgi:hypothetical protein
VAICVSQEWLTLQSRSVVSFWEEPAEWKLDGVAEHLNGNMQLGLNDRPSRTIAARAFPRFKLLTSGMWLDSPSLV